MLLQTTGVGDGLLLIGTIRPVKATGRAGVDAPQLRGWRVYRSRVPTPVPDVIPSTAVEHDRSAMIIVDRNRLVYMFER